MFDVDQRLVSGPAITGKATGAPKDLKIMVKEPTNSNKIYTGLQYSGHTWLAGGRPPKGIANRLGLMKNIGLDSKHYCEPFDRLKDWRPVGAGYERDFNCYFWADPGN